MSPWEAQDDFHQKSRNKLERECSVADRAAREAWTACINVGMTPDAFRDTRLGAEIFQSVECPWKNCPRYFSNRTKLEKHLRDTHGVDKDGATPVIEACAKGALDLVQEWADQIPRLLQRPDFYGNSPLHIAALNGHANVVAHLIHRECDVECDNDIGESPLTHAVKNDHLAVVKLLLDAGADPERRNLAGDRALDLVHEVMENPAAIRQLLKAAIYRRRTEGVDIDIDVPSSPGNQTSVEAAEPSPDFPEAPTTHEQSDRTSNSIALSGSGNSGTPPDNQQWSDRRTGLDSQASTESNRSDAEDDEPRLRSTMPVRSLSPSRLSYSRAVGLDATHWAQNFSDGRLPGHAFTAGYQIKARSVCYGTADIAALSWLEDDGFVPAYEVSFDDGHLSVGLYWRRSDDRARILIEQKDDIFQQRHYCSPLTKLKVIRDRSSLQLCHLIKNEASEQLKYQVWARLNFDDCEKLVLFYDTFVAMKRQDSRPVEHDALLDENELAGSITYREEELVYAGMVQHDRMLHGLRLYRDRGSSVVRLEASALRGPMKQVPIWTAFVTDYAWMGETDWASHQGSGVVTLAALSPPPYVFLGQYEPPRGRDGLYVLHFTSENDAKAFLERWSGLCRDFNLPDIQVPADLVSLHSVRKRRSDKSSLARLTDVSWICKDPNCTRMFAREDNMKDHMRRQHDWFGYGADSPATPRGEVDAAVRSHEFGSSVVTVPNSPETPSPHADEDREATASRPLLNDPFLRWTLSPATSTPSGSGLGLVKCDLSSCNRVFESEEQMQTHMADVHYRPTSEAGTTFEASLSSSGNPKSRAAGHSTTNDLSIEQES